MYEKKPENFDAENSRRSSIYMSICNAASLWNVRYDDKVFLEAKSLEETEVGPEGEWTWNARQDVEFAHNHPSFSKVLHICHKYWHGIRAAAGSLPGLKLAIPDAPLSPESSRELVGQILTANPDRIIFHGMSGNFKDIIMALAAAGLSKRLFVVFHGSPSQWWVDAERVLAFEALTFKSQNTIRGLHFMKAGFRVPGVDVFSPMLLNLSPQFAPDFKPTAPTLNGVAFFPGWGDWRKNVFASALGAACSQHVKEVWVFAQNIQLPPPANDKLRIISPAERTKTFELFHAASVSVNASIIDCHPMVNVESQTIGRPCLRGPLFLDALESHPYVKLTTIENVQSILDISHSLDQILSVPEVERRELTLDYQGQVDAIAIKRYQEFLEI